MAKLATALIIASASLMTATAAAAQTTSAGQEPPAQGSNVTVHGPERMVCRTVTRTATRMRAARVCRPVSQIRAEDQRSQDEVLADAADSLEMYGEKVSTNDVGGLSRADDTPLGPR